MQNFKAGKFVSQGYYKSFVPEPINHAWQINDMELISLLSRADRALGKFDMFSEYVPDIGRFIRMHQTKEATQSTKIEGTQTNIEEVLMDQKDVSSNRQEDWREVHNYIDAMNYAIVRLEELPFSGKLIREVHALLLKGVRGKDKKPGEFRISQNWIGGTSLNDAVFIPPVHEDVPELMNDIEKFIHNEELAIPELIKIGIIHYQFETIHPFLDGNGRVGRLLITLYLLKKGLLKNPILYMSDFFERNRRLYYDNLMLVRTEGNLTQWLKFFLAGVIEISEKGCETFDAILKLQNKTEQELLKLGKRYANAHKLIDHMYVNPIVTALEASQLLGISLVATYNLMAELENLGVARNLPGGRRRHYIFSEYLALFH